MYISGEPDVQKQVGTSQLLVFKIRGKSGVEHARVYYSFRRFSMADHFRVNNIDKGYM